MELKVGMYVRTKWGIAKIREVEIVEEILGREIQPITVYYVDRCLQPIDETKCFKEDIIGEPSFDIMDIIQRGDYINGRLVHSVGYNFQDDWVIKMSDSNYEDFIYALKDGDVVVTKEQFESMQYEVGE